MFPTTGVAQAPTDFGPAPSQGAYAVAKAPWLSGALGPRPSTQFPPDPPTGVGMALTDQNAPHIPEHLELPGTLALCWADSGDGRGLAGRRGAGAGGWGLPAGDHGFVPSRRWESRPRDLRLAARAAPGSAQGSLRVRERFRPQPTPTAHHEGPAQRLAGRKASPPAGRGPGCHTCVHQPAPPSPPPTRPLQTL